MTHKELMEILWNLVERNTADWSADKTLKFYKNLAKISAAYKQKAKSKSKNIRTGV